MIRKLMRKEYPAEGTPLIIAIVLVLLLLFSAVSEYSRLWIIVQGVREATQDAVLTAVNDNYDDVYHAVREGYAAGWVPAADGWTESRDTGDLYGHLSKTLGLVHDGTRYVRYSGEKVEFSLSDFSVQVRNNGLRSGETTGYTAEAALVLEIPVRFLTSVLPPLRLPVHVQASYTPVF